jgi:hypothetical protein
MLRLKCDIRIGSLRFDYVNDISIESSWKNFTDTCTITLPRNLKLRDKQLPQIIKVGDSVTVSFGYNDKLREEFTGFVSALKPGTPFQVICEDAMWQFKRKALTKQWSNVSLQEVVNYIMQQNGVSYPVRAVKSNLGKFTILKATGSQVFDELRKAYGLYSFFRNGELIIGLPYDPDRATKHKYEFKRNIIDADLQYAAADDLPIKVKAISNQPDGKKRTFETPGEGAIRTMNFYNLSQSELEAAADRELKRLKFDGYRGSLSAFGVPAVEHGDIAQITDPDYPERSGSYYIDAVTKSFGVGGNRRKVTLGPKA